MNPAAANTIRIAIPCFGEEVAPLFGSTRRFRVWLVVGGQIADYEEIEIDASDSIARVRLMRSIEADVILANGIEARLRQLLETENRLVVEGIVGTATDVLYGYLAGRIKGTVPQPGEGVAGRQTADVSAWTSDLLNETGWMVRQVREVNIFPVDLIAKRGCPLCGKPVRVAVCCGAHAYRVDEEIREFQRVTATGYHARLYVHQAIPSVIRQCSEYSIEVLSPDRFASYQQSSADEGELPPLQGRIEGHPGLNRSLTV